jgi:RNA polymerase sigma-70 factor, ECF subfamily
MPVVDSQLELRLEQHRVELRGYCYRMLGSSFEADDAVQETLLRAWRNIESFEGRAALRSWLYRIATNVCLDMLSASQRRARPMDLGPARSAESPLGKPLAEAMWIEPISMGHGLSASGDPADAAELHENVRLAFVAALHHLPPRQRAVLILRDVLRWKATEVAELLDTSVQSVNSLLQRARSTLRERDVGEPLDTMDARQRELLARYVDAFERYDMESLTSLLYEDATWSMPTYDRGPRTSRDRAAGRLLPWGRGPQDASPIRFSSTPACFAVSTLASSASVRSLTRNASRTGRWQPFRPKAESPVQTACGMAATYRDSPRFLARKRQSGRPV